MAQPGDKCVRFVPERYRREAARVRREAEAEEDGAVRGLLCEVADRFEKIAQTMEATERSRAQQRANIE